MEIASFWIAVVALLLSIGGIAMTILIEKARQPQLELLPQSGGVGDEEGYRKIHLLVRNKIISGFWRLLGFQRIFAEDCTLQVRIRKNKVEIIKDWFNLAASEYPMTYKFRCGPNPDNPVPIVVAIKFRGEEGAFALPYIVAHKKTTDQEIRTSPMPKGVFLLDAKLQFGSKPVIPDLFQLNNPDATLQQFTITKPRS